MIPNRNGLRHRRPGMGAGAGAADAGAAAAPAAVVPAAPGAVAVPAAAGAAGADVNRNIRQMPAQIERQERERRERQQLFGGLQLLADPVARAEGVVTRADLENIAARQRRLEEMTEALAMHTAEGRETAARQESLLDRSIGFSTKILNRADAILSLSRDIKSITTQTLVGVRDIQRRIRAGESRGLLRDLIMNEWFALITIFLLHPHLPVTIEFIGPLWGMLVSAGFMGRVIGYVRRRELPLFNEGGPIRWVYNITMSAPHAIFLIFSLSGKWKARALGSSYYGETECLLSDFLSREASFETIFRSMITGFREFISTNNASTASRSAATYTVEFFERQFTMLSERHTHIMTEIRALDPVLFSDNTGFLNLLAQWAAGKLYTVSQTGIRTVLQAPAYMRQTGDLINSEIYLWTAILGFIFDMFGAIFSDFIESIKKYSCGFLCSAKMLTDSANREASSFNPLKLAYKSTSVSLAALMLYMGCPPCKLKMDGGGRRKTRKAVLSKKQTRRIQRGGGRKESLLYNEVIQLSWDYLMIYSMPSIHGISKELMDVIEAKGDMVFSELILSNKWAPVVLAEGIDEWSKEPSKIMQPLCI